MSWLAPKETTPPELTSNQTTVKLHVVPLNWKSCTFLVVGNVTPNISVESKPNKVKVFSWQRDLTKTQTLNLTMWTVKIKVAARDQEPGWGAFRVTLPISLPSAASVPLSVERTRCPVTHVRYTHLHLTGLCRQVNLLSHWRAKNTSPHETGSTC